MTLFLELAAPRRYRMETAFDLAALPKIRAFLEAFAIRQGWDKETADRLVAASEETLLTLNPRESETGQRRRLLLVVRREDERAILEFVAATGEGNLQDRIELLGDARAVETPEEMEVSLRLLRHFASSVRHQQYHDTDIITLQVEVRSDWIRTHHVDSGPIGAPGVRHRCTPSVYARCIYNGMP